MLIIKSAYVEITDRCNLDCGFCYNRSGRKHLHTDMSTDQIRRVLDRLIPMGLQNLSLSGGEPLMHPDWDSIYEIIKEYSDVRFSLLTNGTIDSLYLHKLNSKIDSFYVQVSLDGHDEQTNALIRGPGQFEKTMKTIKKLAADSKPSVKLVISNLNRHSVEPFVEIVLSVGAVPEFAFVNNLGNASDIWGSIALNPIEKIRMIKKIQGLAKQYSVDIRLPFCTSYCPLSDETMPVGVLVKPNGSMHPCQQLYDDEFSFANVFTDHAEDITCSFQRIRDIAGQRLETDYGCQSCITRSVCRKGCMAEAYHNNGDCLADDGHCEMRKRQSLEIGLLDFLEVSR